jgi:secondary thiamine-phosphate synthase enzyme
MPHAQQLSIQTQGQGLYEFTDKVRAIVAGAEVDTGLSTVFVRHTSASLIIQENADPSAKRDLEAWLSRLVPERDELYTHTSEGPDDMPAHVKAALTATSIAIPIISRELTLGTWQGIYLWEHRTAPHTRQVVVQVG